MKYTMLAAGAALAVGAAVAAHAENERPRYSVEQPSYSGSMAEVANNTYTESGVDVASLTPLLAEWDQAGFVAPSKPGQYRVYGRDGYVTSGPGYNAMVSLIRSAVNNTREGRAHDAEIEIAKARNLLAASHLRKE